MAVVRCKMCGGTLELNHDETVGICEYCGTRQTLPKLGNEQKANLYERANHLRRNNEYDKAMGIYEQILNADRTDAESYWSLVLCRYGIEYVEDPASHKRIPTVNRAQFTSVFADEDYKSAIYYADALQKEIYEQEAKAIDEIQKGILAISQKEKPFDVFICYKETDSNGRRTPDSVLATDLYHQLKQEGFKVFFSRITLEDKLGVEYEPYIFAALNSAKVMVVLGTKPEYFEAVWVKNEWSRYLALIKNGAKKMLIPAYRDMDPYDLPEEFSHLQAQDMGKLGFMQDLIRGIKKIVSSETVKPAMKETVVVSGAANANAAPLLRRVFIFLEDGDFVNADEYCEKVLDMEPENAEAYLGKMMAELRVRKREDLALFDEPFDENGNYKKALRFADEAFAAELRGYISAINERKENRRLEALYKNCVRVMEVSETEEEYINAAKNFDELGSFINSPEMAKNCRAKAEEIKIAKLDAVYNNCFERMGFAKTEADYKKVANLFKNISGYRDADEMAMICLENAEKARLQVIYDSAKAKMAENKIKSYEQAIEIFRNISAFEDSENQIYFCQGKIEEIKAKEAEEKIERERKAEQKRIENQRRKENAKRLAKIWSPIIAGVLAFAILLNYVVIPNFGYIKAEINTMVEEAKAEKAEKDAERARKKAEREAAKAEKDNKEDVSEEPAETVTLSEVEVGDTITFGSYEQDNNLENRAEPIEWQVLDIQDGKALVISKYGLEWKAFDQSKRSIAWDISQARDWLNSDFIEISFNEKEQEIITTTKLSNHNNDKYGTKGGNNTEDNVFLLSIEEAEMYFSSDAERQCKPSDKVKEEVAKVFSNGNCYWWLRSPGENQKNVAYVNDSGEIDDAGLQKSFFLALRPAMWISVSVEPQEPLSEEEIQYQKAISLAKENDLMGAVRIFAEMKDYKESDYYFREIISALNSYKTVFSHVYHTVGLKEDGTVVAVGWNEYGQCNVDDWKDIVAVSVGNDYTVGLKADGTVVATGSNDYGQCDVSGWEDIVAVSVGNDYTAGLKADGTVVATGDNKYGQCDVSGWTDIVAVSANCFNTVGLKADGTVVATGRNNHGQCNVSDWKDIVAVYADWDNTVGLKADGTVVATGDNRCGHCNVSGWKDIVAVYTGWSHTVGLKADGTVVAVGANTYGQCNVSGWKDIVAVFKGDNHTVGLKADGTVVATGWNTYGTCDVSGWTDIVSVFAGWGHTVGLKADGTVVATGYNEYGQCNVSDWKDIKLPQKPEFDFEEEPQGTVVSEEISVGGVVTFGSYEQDNNLENGAEPIEWQVLDIQDGKALVISKYGLDCKPYNTEYKAVTWETCSLRKWLNNDFANNAFNANEQKNILITKITNPDNPEYGTAGGKDTEDRVFLFNIEEIEKYFDSSKERICTLSKYASAMATTTFSNRRSNWWLRSTGSSNKVAALVAYVGVVNKSGFLVDYYNFGIRPAMWINISKEEITASTNKSLERDSIIFKFYRSGNNSFEGSLTTLRNDGTVVSTSKTFDFSGWENIIKISGNKHVVGLKADGTVVATGANANGQCNLSDWTEIADIYADKSITVGVKKDGTVVAKGKNDEDIEKIKKWTNISSIKYYNEYWGLKTDGTVVTTNDFLDVSHWTDIVDINFDRCTVTGKKDDGSLVFAQQYYEIFSEEETKDFTYLHTDFQRDLYKDNKNAYYGVALKKDGTVVAKGYNRFGQLNVEGWTDVEKLYGGYYYTAAIKKDGTVLVTNEFNVEGWTDVVELCLGNYYLIGLKADGTVLCTSKYVKDWTDIVEIYHYYDASFGIKSDGTVVVSGNAIDEHTGRVFDVSVFSNVILPGEEPKLDFEKGETKLPSIKVGNVVTFGSYEQDNNLGNGAEPIEWQVLDVKDGKALVISKYGLDSKPYNGKYVDVTWETCSLRNWLNSSFINKAFSVEERKMIAKTSLVNPDNPSYKTRGGNNTVDKVFLLSIDEAKEYFSSDAKRQCKPSAYVKENGTYDFWWLRSPAYIQKHAADVGSDSGNIIEYGVSVSNGGGGMVRPAMWVDLSAFEE